MMTSHHDQPVHRWDGADFSMAKDTLADESVIQLHLNGEHITTLLATNEDLDCLIRGHFATQYNLREVDEECTISLAVEKGVHVVDLLSPGSRVAKKRTEPVTTSCGACDLDGLADIVKETPQVDAPPRTYDLNQVLHLIESLGKGQPLFGLTGGVHAAGLVFENPEDTIIMEDIGRHNAVDKAIGYSLIRDVNRRPLALLLSGRCGWDIVAKAAQMNVPLIVSIGAASSLAATVARQIGMTLCTFSRSGKSTVIGTVNGRFEAKD